MGASVCGEDELFDQIREGKINFERLLCHTDSAAKLNKAGLGKVLGPRGLMPSTKLGTITRDVEGLVKSMVGSTEYREKLGVIRASVGQLGFTPEEMQSNIRVFMEAVKRDLNAMSDKITKEIHEVVSPTCILCFLPSPFWLQRTLSPTKKKNYNIGPQLHSRPGLQSQRRIQKRHFPAHPRSSRPIKIFFSSALPPSPPSPPPRFFRPKRCKYLEFSI